MSFATLSSIVLATLLLALTTSAMIPPTSAGAKSGCFEFFMKQDGCASPSSSNNCRPKVTSGSIQQFMSGGAMEPPYSPFGPGLKKGNTTQAANSAKLSPMAPGVKMPVSRASSKGVCGEYDSTKDFGVCLWSGPDASTMPTSSKETVGWLGQTANDNCHKEVFIQRTGSTNAPISAKVIDGCNFGTSQQSFGCSQIFLSHKAFTAMNPSPEELANGFLKDSITWDFASKRDPANAAA
ncbi:hypothetical protein BY996DRAFT_6411685 [Phakopsora pachyrhizi]|nr:hypothetical protein BY996DRAFT_6411685 [Phakopsora pachyrhizi]